MAPYLAAGYTRGGCSPSTVSCLADIPESRRSTSLLRLGATIICCSVQSKPHHGPSAANDFLPARMGIVRDFRIFLTATLCRRWSRLLLGHVLMDQTSGGRKCGAFHACTVRVSSIPDFLI